MCWKVGKVVQLQDYRRAPQMIRKDFGQGE